MAFIRYIIAAILGCITGILGGAFGLGGSSLMVPGILLTGIIQDYKTAVGTVLLTLVAPTTIFAVIEYYKEKRIDYIMAAILLVTCTSTGYIGARINAHYSTYILEFWSGIVFLFISTYFFWSSYQKHLIAHK